MLPADHGLEPKSTLVILEHLHGLTSVGHMFGLVTGSSDAALGESGGTLAVLCAPAPLSSFQAHQVVQSPLLPLESAAPLQPLRAPLQARAQPVMEGGGFQGGRGARGSVGASSLGGGGAGPLLVERLEEFADRYEISLVVPGGEIIAAAGLKGRPSVQGQQLQQLSGLSVRSACASLRYCSSSHGVEVAIKNPAPGFKAELQLLCPVLVANAGAVCCCLTRADQV